jgi:hypothetical protein
MNAATVGAEEQVPALTPRQTLWLDFYRALGQRNFVRALALARRLGFAEERLRRLERDTLKQCMVDFQNFDAASQLCADYCLTADELAALMAQRQART